MATTIRPVVSLSRRCTMPGLATPPMPDRLVPQWASSALTSVPLSLPAPGCTTSPAGLSMTIRSSSSWTTARSRASGSGSAGRGGGTVTATRWPPMTLAEGSPAGASSRVTCPSRISACKRLRDRSGHSRASARSSRSLPSPGGITPSRFSASLKPCLLPPRLKTEPGYDFGLVPVQARGYTAAIPPGKLPSSSGLGRRPLTAKTGVRVPLGAPGPEIVMIVARRH